VLEKNPPTSHSAEFSGPGCAEPFHRLRVPCEGE
jgi:hypothetical protein